MCQKKKPLFSALTSFERETSCSPEWELLEDVAWFQRRLRNGFLTTISFAWPWTYQEIEPRFLHWTIRASGGVSDYLSETIRGATRAGVNSKIVGSLPCRVPPIEKQRRIVTYLDGLQTQVDALKKLQAQTLRRPGRPAPRHPGPGFQRGTLKGSFLCRPYASIPLPGHHGPDQD